MRTEFASLSDNRLTQDQQSQAEGAITFLHFSVFCNNSTRLVALAIQPKETSGKRFSQLKLSFVVAVVVAVFVMIFCAIEAPRICQLFRATLAYKLQLSGITDNCNCFVIVFILPKKH